MATPVAFIFAAPASTAAAAAPAAPEPVFAARCARPCVGRCGRSRRVGARTDGSAILFPIVNIHNIAPTDAEARQRRTATRRSPPQQSGDPKGGGGGNGGGTGEATRTGAPPLWGQLHGRAAAESPSGAATAAAAQAAAGARRPAQRKHPKRGTRKEQKDRTKEGENQTIYKKKNIYLLILSSSSARPLGAGERGGEPRKPLKYVFTLPAREAAPTDCVSIPRA